jgi:hypothetical protein
MNCKKCDYANKCVEHVDEGHLYPLCNNCVNFNLSEHSKVCEGCYGTFNHYCCNFKPK